MSNHLTNPQDAARERQDLFFDGLHAAAKGQDAEALRVVVPALAKAEARSLIYHSTRLYHAREFGPSSRATGYAAEVWQGTPPTVVLSGTAKVRVAGLLARRPSLSGEDACAIVAERIADELSEGGANGRCFWRWAVDAPNTSDVIAADRLGAERERAVATLEAPTQTPRPVLRLVPGGQAPKSKLSPLDELVASIKQFEAAVARVEALPESENVFAEGTPPEVFRVVGMRWRLFEMTKR